MNDRPYIASSFLSVAISQLYGSALNGRCKDRPDLAATAIPLVARLSVISCRGGEDLLRRLFAPLGWELAVQSHVLDPTVPEWGNSPYFTVTLTGTHRLSELLAHLYVLIPTLDDEKHYWVGDDEVDKLLRHGEGWLAAHPERELIAHRYLKHRHSLAREAIARLVAEEDASDDGDASHTASVAEETLEKPIGLNEQRLGSVLGALRASKAASVVDLGCGEGRLLRMLLDDRQFTRVVGMDVSYRTLEIASDRLKLDRLPPMQRERIALIHGSLMYRDERLAGFDVAAVVEVIEHLDPPRLAAFERVAFEFARPATIILTTPNAEFNTQWPTLPAGKFRHRDHRFEWTRAQLESWASLVAGRFGYAVRFAPVGPVDENVGPPMQMAIFTRDDLHV